MKNKNSKFYITVILLIILFKSTYAQNKVQATLDKYKDSIGTYGIVAMVSYNNKITVGQIGYSSPDIKIRSEQVFGIGSLTKLFTATCILKLCEQKKMDLNDPIGKYINPKNKFIDTAITIRQLLNHSSGIKDFTSNSQFLNFFLFNPKELYSITDFLGQLDTINFPKGTQHVYSNSNYILLGLIIEKVTDEPLYFAVDDLLLKPYKLSHTYPYLSTSIPDIVHAMYNNQDLFNQVPFQIITEQSKGAGQMASTLADLNNFFDLLLVKKKILDASMLREMLTFEKGDDDDDEYGLGIFRSKINNNLFINHTGRQVSYQSFLFYDPRSNKVVTVLVNNMSDKYARKVLKALLND